MDAGAGRPLLIAGIGLALSLLTLAVLIAGNLPGPLTVLLALGLVTASATTVGLLVSILREGHGGTRRA